MLSSRSSYCLQTKQAHAHAFVCDWDEVDIVAAIGSQIDLCVNPSTLLKTKELLFFSFLDLQILPLEMD